MKVFTKLFFTLVLCVLGVMTVDAQDKVYATFESPTGITWDSEAKTFSCSSPYGNQLHNIGLPNGNLTSYEKLVIDCEILEGDGYRFMFYANSKGTTAGGVTIVTESGKKEYNLSDFSMDAAYLTDCQEICLSGYNGSGKVKVNEVYLVKSSDPLALPKENLSKAIAKAKLCTSIGKTAESFAALQTAITTAQAAYDATDATEESLTSAMKTLNNAVDALALADGYTNLSADMFKQYASLAEPGEGTAVAGAPCVLFTASGLPYGDGNVSELKWADLAGYDKLIVVVAGEVKPRFCMNRLEANGQQAETKADSKMLDINPNNEYTWSTEAYETIDGKTFTIDLKKIVDDYNFARLHCIKAQGYGTSVIVTDMLLYKEAAPAATEVTFDFDASDHAASSSTDHAGDITEDEVLTQDGVVLTITPSGGSTANRYWGTSPKMRMYGGTMTLVAPEGKAITKVVVNNGKWNAGNTFNDVAAATGEWEGNSTNVILAVAANTQIKSVVVTLADKTEETTTFVPVHIANTAETAYTVAKAIELIEAGKALGETVFVKGIVSEVEKFDESKKYITYWISDDGTTKQFECYQGKGIDGADFASIDDVKVGATVVATGLLTKYNETYEFKAGNKLVTYEAPFVPAIADGTYYIKNVGSGNFLAGANAWGTQASVTPAGVLFEVALLEGTHGYSLKNTLVTVAKKFLGSNLYTDSDTPAGGFAIEKAADGSLVIKLGDKYLAEGTETGSTNDKILVTTDELTDAAKWQFLTKEEAIASLADATPEAPKSATFLISNPNFNRNTSVAAWTVSQDCTNKNLSGGDGKTGNNFCAESYHSPFTVSQVLADAPAGKYRLTAQGFYRQDDGAAEAAPVFFANDKTGNVPEKTGTENSMTDASNSFTAGNYTIEPIEVTVAAAGGLTIGVKNNGNTHQWVIWDNFQLTYLGNQIDLSELVAAYEEAKTAASAALADEANAIVTGEERAALTTAISENAEVEQTQEALTAAIAALTTATSNFTGAKAAYTALATVKAQADVTAFKYASDEKKAAVETAKEATATSAADATAKAETLVKAYRQYAESSALLEGVDGAVNKTEAITNPKAETAVAEPWKTVLGEGSAGSIGILSSEPWTDGEGVSAHKYFDGGNWGANSWDVSLTQDITLQKGKYQLTVKSRASQDVAFTLFASETKTQMQTIGATGGLFDRGWNDASVEFELDKDSTITIGVQGVTSVIHNWMSFSDFRLVQFPVPHDQIIPAEVAEPTYSYPASWNFANWSDATVANLKADAAWSIFNGWSDVEKDPAATDKNGKLNPQEPTEASKDNCFWHQGKTDKYGQLYANGVLIEELKGLKFTEAYAATRGLAIAVNYPSTSLGTYDGGQYLWLGGGGKGVPCFELPNVPAGMTITIAVESHKASDARGVELYAGSIAEENKIGDTFKPKAKDSHTWTITEAGNIVVYNTNGCHIYSIGVSVDTGINAVEAGLENGAVYNLNGQKVQKAQKGLYIIGGRKVVIK